MAKMNNNEIEAMEKKLAEYLNERFEICTAIPDTSGINNAFYEGAWAAVAQIGGWKRDDNGKHFVKLNG